MKKLLLLSVAIFIASISNTFAYQSYTLYPTDPSGQYGGAQVQVNAYCNYIGFQANFSVNAFGSAVAYETGSGGTGGLIGEYFYYQTTDSNTYSNTIVNYQYWNTIQMYISTNTAYGAYATLFWD